MTIRTRALVARGDGSAPEVVDLLLAEPGPSDALVEIAAAAVCSTERTVVAEGAAPADALPGTAFTVLGHAAVGTVSRIGSAVTRVAPGDTVVVTGTRQCGDCWYCAHGVPGACDDIFRFMHRRVGQAADGTPVWTDGGMGTHAERMVLPDSNVVAIPNRVPDAAPAAHLALLGCGATSGIGAVRDVAGVRAGDSVVVVGLGHLGLWMVQGARACGAAEIIALDPSPLRRRIAQELGATAAWAPGADTAERIRARTGGRGADVALEAAGTVRAIEDAFALARYGGTVVPTGLESGTAVVALNNLQLALGSRRIIGAQCGGGDVRRMVPEFAAWMDAGTIDPEPLITDRLPLERAPLAYERFTDPAALTSLIVMHGARREDPHP